MNRDDRLGLRVRVTDKKLWKAVAAAQGKSLSNWIETTLNKAARKGNGPG